MEQQQNPERRKPSTGLKVTVLVLLIILLIIGILLPIKIVPGALSSIANTLTSIFIPKEKVKLSVSKAAINSGEAFTLNWSGSRRTNGSYTLFYDCTPGVKLEVSVNQPYEVIPCDAQYYFTPSTNSVDITGFSQSTRYADAHITLGFLENSASSIDKLGDTTITITNPELSENIPSGTSTTSLSTSTATTTVTPSPVTPAPTPTPTPTPTLSPTPIQRPTPSAPRYRASNPYGLADLEVRIIATGHLSQTGVFIASPAAANEQSAIRFQIVNVGDKNTGSWYFGADLPSVTDAHYTSPTQINLGPGDRIEYTLGFSNLTSGTGNIATITADPTNSIPEYSKANNTARAQIGNPVGVTPTSQPDLVVRILTTGVINRSTNQFTPTGTVGSGDRAGLRFEVQNVGGTQSGSWRFRAALPTSDSNSSTYISDTQPSLRPGERALFTLGFDNIQYAGANTATVTVDDLNTISESNEGNNSASVSIIRSY